MEQGQKAYEAYQKEYGSEANWSGTPDATKAAWAAVEKALGKKAQGDEETAAPPKQQQAGDEGAAKTKASKKTDDDKKDAKS